MIVKKQTLPKKQTPSKQIHILLTTRCNALCAHCMLSCTEHGDDMSYETFLRALDFIPVDTGVVLFGGEPLIHPQYRDFVRLAASTHHVMVGSNGLHTENLLWTLEWTHRPNFELIVAQTPYHVPLEPSIIQQVQEKGGVIRYKQILLIPEGRASSLDSSEKYFGCACNCYWVWPNGDISNCGCPDSEIVGNVNTRAVDTRKRKSCKKERHWLTP